jgi:predicted component of type VI protein secretion system
MARKTVISKVLDVEAQDGIIEFPQNRALYADQFTDEAPQSDEDRAEFKAKNMKDVFEHYQPSKKGIALENEEGGAVYEDFDFKSLKDFEDESLIEQSALMGAAKDKIDAYNAVIRQLEKNKSLRSAMKDPTQRGNLKNALQALLAELDEAE